MSIKSFLSIFKYCPVWYNEKFSHFQINKSYRIVQLSASLVPKYLDQIMYWEKSLKNTFINAGLTNPTNLTWSLVTYFVHAIIS
jgi:hypothetical protein